jgi:hypothetical protein
MKYILAVLMILPVVHAFSQEMQINVSANNKSISVSPDDKNTDKLFVIENAPAGNDFLTIRITNDETEKDWKRSFSIYDSTGNAIKDFVFMKDGSYCTRISELKKALQPQQDYFIYTMAIPKDPNKAMLVKVARKLVCKIKIL